MHKKEHTIIFQEQPEATPVETSAEKAKKEETYWQSYQEFLANLP